MISAYLCHDFFLLAGNTPNKFKTTELARSQTELHWEWYGVDVDLSIPHILHSSSIILLQKELPNVYCFWISIFMEHILNNSISGCLSLQVANWNYEHKFCKFIHNW